MDITRKFSRIGIVLLPIVLLAVFFKYLHPLNTILHGIEGWGARKIALTLFISFFCIWSLLYVSSVFFSLREFSTVDYPVPVKLFGTGFS